MIKTSSFFTTLPVNHLRIGIARFQPRNLNGPCRNYRPLAPGRWFNSCASPHEYLELYSVEILEKLDAGKVRDQIEVMANGNVAVLCCWEPPPPNDKWCHRGIVSAWFKDTIGLDVPELGHERAGTGWQHPKLHPDLMRKS